MSGRLSLAYAAPRLRRGCSAAAGPCSGVRLVVHLVGVGTRVERGLHVGELDFRRICRDGFPEERRTCTENQLISTSRRASIATSRSSGLRLCSSRSTFSSGAQGEDDGRILFALCEPKVGSNTSELVAFLDCRSMLLGFAAGHRSSIWTGAFIDWSSLELKLEPMTCLPHVTPNP